MADITLLPGAKIAVTAKAVDQIGRDTPVGFSVDNPNLVTLSVRGDDAHVADLYGIAVGEAVLTLTSGAFSVTKTVEIVAASAQAIDVEVSQLQAV